MSITIVGLGPGAPQQLTQEAWQLLEAASEVWLRTRHHPTVGHLPPHLQLSSFDDLYESCPSYPELYHAIAQQVIKLSQRPQGVIYAVPGHPLVGEATVRLILEQARRQGIEVRLIPGLSFVDAALALLGLDPLEAGLQIVDALDPRFDPGRPALVAQLHSRALAQELKVSLLEHYPAEHPATLVWSAGIPSQQRTKSLPLYLIDREEFDPLTCLYLPALSPQENLGALATLEYIFARLRAPDGCPWDREQTHASLQRHLLQESYEVIAAIEAQEPEQLAEELGDLIMQIAFHAQIAAEAGEFSMRDVLRHINAKLIRRHPHVFGATRLATAAEVAHQWEEIKRTERGEEVPLLASVPTEMPALAYSQAIQDRASASGFDWKDIAGVLSKVVEELEELSQAPSPEERRAEFGDLLFILVNVARWLGLDAEETLRLANQRFARRFTLMEALSRERGQTLSRLSPPEWDALWEEVKTKSSP